MQRQELSLFHLQLFISLLQLRAILGVHFGRDSERVKLIFVMELHCGFELNVLLMQNQLLYLQGFNESLILF